MEEVKINVDDYALYGLGDIYYGLISFISSYITQNYDPLEILKNGESQYAFAVSIMKSSLKELLDYLKTVDEIYLPSLNRNVKLSTLNLEEQLALEARCKEYMILSLNSKMNANMQKQTEETVENGFSK